MTAIIKSAGRTRTVKNVNMMAQVNHEKWVLSLIIYHNSQAIRCTYFPDKFIHSIGMCRIPCHSRQLIPFLSVKYFFLSPFSTNHLSSSLISSCHLFLGLPLNLVFPKFIYNTLLGSLLPSILCTCPNQNNIFNLTVSITVGFLHLHKFLY